MVTKPLMQQGLNLQQVCMGHNLQQLLFIDELGLGHLDITRMNMAPVQDRYSVAMQHQV